MSVKKNCKFLLILFGLLSLILSFQCSQFSAYATQSKKQNFSTNYTLTGNGGIDMVAIASAQIGKTGKQLVPHWQDKAMQFLHMEEQIIWIPTS